MAKKLLALVKWCGGPDADTYTSDIPIEWIRDFQYDNFKSENFNSSDPYVIEWRDKRKEPAEGWNVYDAYIIEVSDKKKVLKRKLAFVDGIKSPTKIITCSDEMNCNEMNQGHSSRHGRNSKENGEPSTTSKRSRKKDENENSDPESIRSFDGSSTISGCTPIIPQHKKAKTLLDTTGHKEFGNHGAELAAIRKSIQKLRRKVRANDDDSSTTSEDEMKEIGRGDCKASISAHHWELAKTERSYTAMGIRLLMSLFPMNVLLKSNLKGGRSKISKEGQRNQALDPKILGALFHAVQKRWKSTFNAASLGVALNNKLGRLRSENKKKTASNDINDEG